MLSYCLARVSISASLAPATSAPLLKSPPAASAARPPMMACRPILAKLPLSSWLFWLKSPTQLKPAAAKVLANVLVRASPKSPPWPRALLSVAEVTFCSAWLAANWPTPPQVLKPPSTATLPLLASTPLLFDTAPVLLGPVCVPVQLSYTPAVRPAVMPETACIAGGGVFQPSAQVTLVVDGASL